MSGWDPSHDRDQRDVAAALTRRHRFWWVMWSPSLRQWVGFHLGPHRVAPLRHTDPDHLAQRMRAVDRKLARHRPA